MIPLGILTQQTYGQSLPEFITDGLQIHLDAGNPASYPGSGSVWSDLSGNGRTHSIGSAAYGVDGAVKYIHYTSGAAPFISVGSYVFTTEYTMTGWAKAYLTTTNTWQTLWRTSGFHPLLIDAGDTAIGGYYGGFQTFGVAPAAYRNVWTMYSVVGTGGNSLLYINGVYAGTIPHNETGRSWVNISYASQPFGPVATTAVYNRPLSAAEDLQNFNATKALYGL